MSRPPAVLGIALASLFEVRLQEVRARDLGLGVLDAAGAQLEPEQRGAGPATTRVIEQIACPAAEIDESLRGTSTVEQPQGQPTAVDLGGAEPCGGGVV